MAQQISENTQVQLDLKTIGIIVGGAIAKCRKNKGKKKKK